MFNVLITQEWIDKVNDIYVSGLWVKDFVEISNE